jgi:hypothetical protein
VRQNDLRLLRRITPATHGCASLGEEAAGATNCERLAGLRRSLWSPALLPKASLSLLERPNRAQEVDLAELRPINVREVKFAMDTLP